MDNTQERLRVFRLLMKRPSWMAILQQALQLERERDEEYEVKGLGEFLGYQHFHVGTYNQVLMNMVARGLLYLVKDIGSSKFFRVKI